MLKDVEYVDFNKQKLNLLGYQLDVGKSKNQKARILIAEKGAKSLILPDWLNASNYQFVSPNQKEGNNAISKVTTKNSYQITSKDQMKRVNELT